LARAEAAVLHETEARDGLTESEKRRSVGRFLRAVAVWADEAKPSGPVESDGPYQEFARAVWAATSENSSREAVMRTIAETATHQSRRLTPARRKSGIARVLHAVAAAARSLTPLRHRAT
jgi:hypothetical protein